MELHSKRILAAAVVLASQALLCGVAAEPDSGISREEQRTRVNVNALCGQTITNIYDDVAKLTNRFPVVTGLSETNILSNRARLTGNLNWEYHSLRYLKNLRVERPPISPNGLVSASGELRTLGKGGLILEVFLCQGDVKVPHSQDYLLPYGTGDNQLRLICHLEENPPDLQLDKALRDIVKARAEQLRRALESM